MIALDGVEFKKHTGNIAYFRKENVKTGILDVELSDIIESVFSVRSGSDYNDFYIVSKEVQDMCNLGEGIYEEAYKKAEKEKAIAIAQKLIVRGKSSVSEIVEDTGLSVEEVEELCDLQHV